MPLPKNTPPPRLRRPQPLRHGQTPTRLDQLTNWNGPLTSATSHIIARFISNTIGVTTLPHHALFFAQLSLNTGGLGILDPWTRSIPDFMLTFTTSTRHATNGIYLSKHLNNVYLYPTIAALYSTNTNPQSLILKRFHHILPNIVTSSCPPTIPRTDLTQYFLTTLSPHSARGRLKNILLASSLRSYTTMSSNMNTNTSTSSPASSPPTHHARSLQCLAAASKIVSPR